MDMQLGKRFKRGPGIEELPEYARARHLLASLGMAKYQSNLKRGMLTDATLLLWNDRRAPPCSAASLGPRYPPGINCPFLDGNKEEDGVVIRHAAKQRHSAASRWC